MADTGKGDAVAGGAACDASCGCAVPCHGGSNCRCTSAEAAAGGTDHLTCSCGEHCECKPCTCPKTVAAGASCRCGPGCTCASCRT